MVFNLVAICVQDFGAVINKLVLMVSSLYLLHLLILTIHFNVLSDAEAFFMATRLLQFWWFLTMHSGNDSCIIVLFFKYCPFGLTPLPLCFHFLIKSWICCSVCFAVELLYQWWWSMLTISSRYAWFIIFIYICCKQCCWNCCINGFEVKWIFITIVCANCNTLPILLPLFVPIEPPFYD